MTMTKNNTAEVPSNHLLDDGMTAFGLVQNEIREILADSRAPDEHVEVKERKKPGRPKKQDPEKREPVLMLRMNAAEREKLDDLIYKYGWTGEPAVFVRELILRKKPRSKGDLGLHAIDDLAATMMPMIKHFLSDVALGKDDRAMMENMLRTLSQTSKYIRKHAKK
ncbi:hypothetical protein [Marinobacter qingdaonensis]|uniref:Uncharacterized protein n=1 Tax=Marinobacter qingdaonensis TaxID=3108486 RepID=A0ABU5NUV0_9GAMM|nr:hypothetical protein [Marinobacter sp. ASW11-75]MEA1079542.1 hypothetical protein [Marinobacter sp. ASW11-75]